MSLSEILTVLSGEETPSFRLMGDDLALLPGAALREAAARYEAERAQLPSALRGRFEMEQQEVLREAHGLLRRYNRSIHTRVRGYLDMGRRVGFEYPWPAVAILGICQVMTGLSRTHLYGLIGPTARRLGFHLLERVAEGIDDVLRRTNRSIFADSVPTLLYALHARKLATQGDVELAEALLTGPLPPIFDQETRRLSRALYDALRVPNGEARFRALANLTRQHFSREQAIFSHHLGAERRDDRGRLSKVPAPFIKRGSIDRRLVFRSFELPAGFDLRDHEARVDAFGRAFVDSITADVEDYRAAVIYVLRRFGMKNEQIEIPFAHR